MGSKETIPIILAQPLHDLERTATFKVFPLSMWIDVTTLSVDEKPFLCHVPSTETLRYAACSVPHSLAAASDILFSATCLDGTFME